MFALSRGWVASLLAAAVLGLGQAPGLRAQEPLTKVGTIPLKGRPGNLDYVNLDTKRDRLLVANKANGTLDIVDLKAGKLLMQIPGQDGVQGIAYAADQDRVYVGLGEGGFVNVFTAEDFKLVKTLKFKDDADAVRYNQATQRLYVAHADKALGVIDTKALSVKADVKLPGGAEAFQLETGRPRLYLNVPSSNLVIVIDTEKNTVVQQFPLTQGAGNYAMALDEPNHRLFVSCRKKPVLVVLDTETGKELAAVPIPTGTDDLWFDAKRKLLYTSCGEGFLAVIRQQDADRYEAAARIPTTKGAKNCYFDAATGRLFLSVPRQGGKPGPEIEIYQAP